MNSILRKFNILEWKNVYQSFKYVRTFLSQAYPCTEVWDHRLNNVLLKKVNLEEFYQELDQRYQRSGLISAVDVDVFAHAVSDNVYIDELLDIAHKLRLSAETSNTLSSTPHAIIRYLFKHDRHDELLAAVDDRLNYGLFLDYFTANILMDKYYLTKAYAKGMKVAMQLMLQEEVKHPLSQCLGLLHCYSYLLEPQGWVEPPKPEEPEEEIKIRVKYLRNPYDDNHFDLKDPIKIAGKTLIAMTKGLEGVEYKSLHILGLGLFGDHEKAKHIINHTDKIADGILKLLPDDNSTKEACLKLSRENCDLSKFLEESVVNAERQMSEKDIADQCKTYKLWEEERNQAMERQKERLMIAQRLEHIEKIQSDLKLKEEKLWFFENEENIEMEIEMKEELKKLIKIDKKKKDEQEYIPPEI